VYCFAPSARITMAEQHGLRIIVSPILDAEEYTNEKNVRYSGLVDTEHLQRPPSTDSQISESSDSSTVNLKPETPTHQQPIPSAYHGAKLQQSLPDSQSGNWQWTRHWKTISTILAFYFAGKSLIKLCNQSSLSR
jgi:hypothetical protein